MSELFVVSLLLSDSSLPGWRRLLRAAGMKSEDAQDNPSIELAVISAGVVDDVLSTLDDDVSAAIKDFGFIPAADGLYLTAKLDGEIVEAAEAAGVSNVSLVVGRLTDVRPEDLSDFIGDSLAFDYVTIKSATDGTPLVEKYIQREDDDE